MRLPSAIKYSGKGFVATFSEKPGEFVAWYLGLHNATEEVLKAILTSDFVALTNEETRTKIEKYINIDQIPQEYKTNRDYYDSYETQKKFYYPKSLPENHILKQNEELVNVIAQVFDSRLSPLLADDEKLIGLPKAYFVRYKSLL